jgi:hypothetical protein
MLQNLDLFDHYIHYIHSKTKCIKQKKWHLKMSKYEHTSIVPFATASLPPPPNPLNKTAPTELLKVVSQFRSPDSILYELLQKSYLQSVILLPLHLTYVEHF